MTDAELDRRINDCITKYIEDNRIREAIGEAIGMLHNELQEDIEQKIGALKAEIEVLSSVVKNNRIELVRKGQRDVA